MNIINYMIVFICLPVMTVHTRVIRDGKISFVAYAGAGVNFNAHGYLGNNIVNSGFNFDAGANTFVGHGVPTPVFPYYTVSATTDNIGVKPTVSNGVASNVSNNRPTKKPKSNFGPQKSVKSIGGSFGPSTLVAPATDLSSRLFKRW